MISLHRLLPLLTVIAVGLASGCALDVGSAPAIQNGDVQDDGDTGGASGHDGAMAGTDVSSDALLGDGEDATETSQDTTTPGDDASDTSDQGPDSDISPPPDVDPIDDTWTIDAADIGPVDDALMDAPGPADDTLPDDDTLPEDDTGPIEDVGNEAPPTRAIGPVTFTHTLSVDGLTLRPLGPRHGFTGVLTTSDGALRLEALP